MAAFVFNPAEFPPLNSAEFLNSAESTHHSQQMKKTSFSEAALNSKNLKSLPSDSKNFFLADSNPTPIGTVSAINGRPTLAFSDTETEELAAHYKLAFIGKFSHGAPPYRNLHRLVVGLGVKGGFTVTMMNSKHVLILLSNDSDYSRLWLRRIWYLQGYPMRIFKWSPTFTPGQELSVIPIWACLPDLPAHLFSKKALFSIAGMIGIPLQIDEFTLNQSKLSKARVCVEIDLTKPLMEEFDLLIYGTTISQRVEYEQAAKQYQAKGKNVAEPQVHQVFDKMPEKNPPITGSGECSKTAEDCHRYVSESVFVNARKADDIAEVNQNNDVYNKNHADETTNGTNAIASEKLEVGVVCEEVNALYGGDFENRGIEVENSEYAIVEAIGEKLEVENNEYACVETVCTLDNNVVEDVACALKNNIVEDVVVGNEIVEALILRPSYTDYDPMRGMKLFNDESTWRLFQSLEKFGVVAYELQNDEDENIEMNRIALHTALFFQKHSLAPICIDTEAEEHLYSGPRMGRIGRTRKKRTWARAKGVHGVWAGVRWNSWDWAGAFGAGLEGLGWCECARLQRLGLDWAEENWAGIWTAAIWAALVDWTGLHAGLAGGLDCTLGWRGLGRTGGLGLQFAVGLEVLISWANFGPATLLLFEWAIWAVHHLGQSGPNKLMLLVFKPRPDVRVKWARFWAHN
ncbi:UNVERIFIED_CONTAM: hypothetical protein Slati_2718300 [Sesamum latifolium]|uniref:DUF4283 domain-containing protein n=1 Tax=Sesamum latifolium TaxID=2727402 RepID=A0AAW2VWG4_9LAMI